MTTADDRGPTLDWTGERYVPELSGNIRLEHIHRYLLARELSHGRRVLDIACGEGYGSDLLAEVASSVVGIDLVVEVVQHARNRYQRPHLAFAAGNCGAIPLADSSIDVVVCFETLEHHDQHDQMMREIARVLRPDGLLMISSPDRDEYSEVPGYRNPFHAKELDRSEFAQLLESHFSHVRLVGQRIRAGSIVGPLEAREDTAFVDFHGAGDNPNRSEGLRAPLYLIGVATNGPMPAVPAGIFDGGDFIWSTDYAAAIAAADERARATAAALQEEIVRRGVRIDELESARGELQTLTNNAHGFLEDARQQILDTQGELAAAETHFGDTGSKLAAAEHQLGDARSRLAAAESQLAGVRSELNDAYWQLEAQRGKLESLESFNRRVIERLREREGDVIRSTASSPTCARTKRRLRAPSEISSTCVTRCVLRLPRWRAATPGRSRPRSERRGGWPATAWRLAAKSCQMVRGQLTGSFR